MALPKLVDLINTKITEQAVPSPGLVSTSAETTLKTFTIAKAGIYIFSAEVPINFYGASGRELNVLLKVDGIEKIKIGGVLNINAYTKFSAMIGIIEIPKNSQITVVAKSSTDATYTIGAFKLNYYKINN